MILQVARGTEYADVRTLRGRLHLNHPGTAPHHCVHYRAGPRRRYGMACIYSVTLPHRYLDPDPLLLATSRGQEANISNPRFHALNQAIVQLVSVEFITPCTPIARRCLPPCSCADAASHPRLRTTLWCLSSRSISQIQIRWKQ